MHVVLSMLIASTRYRRERGWKRRVLLSVSRRLFCTSLMRQYARKTQYLIVVYSIVPRVRPRSVVAYSIYDTTTSMLWKLTYSNSGTFSEVSFCCSYFHELRTNTFYVNPLDDARKYPHKDHYENNVKHNALLSTRRFSSLPSWLKLQQNQWYGTLQW